MNFLTKIHKALGVSEEAQVEANDIVCLQNHINFVSYRKMPRFVVYSSRRVRSQLNS